MSIPQPPQDIQLMNIIDKLAQFVARNGKEFEQMTLEKQTNNSRFNFLRPGEEFYDYYQYKVMENRRNPMMNIDQPQQLSLNNSPWSSNGSSQQANLSTQIDVINTQQIKLREQINQSGKNLQAQHQVLLQQQKTQIEEALSNAQTEHIGRCAQENQINLNELDEVLQPIIDSCTKDSIANGKASILQQATNSAKRQIISQYILKNVKKNADDLKNCLESVVIPMFCNATINANEEQKDKLSKLLNLWSSKANFFDSCAISKLESPQSSLEEHNTTLVAQYASAITPLTQASKSTFEQYKTQHQAFVQHASSQLSVLENQRQLLEKQMKQQQQPSPLLPEFSQTPAQMIPSLINNVNMLMQSQQPPPALQNQFNSPPNNNQFFNLPPPNFLTSIPDFSRPPPGFDSQLQAIEPQQQQPLPVVEEINLQPTLPYFELSAGLMVPLIRLEDHKYFSIDPDELRLPPPTAPSERLLNAIEAFYAPPSHERPRDNEGWEKLGLYEYFKMKNAVRKQRDEEIMRGERDRSKSPSPIPPMLTRPPRKIKKRIYRSKSPEDKKSLSRSTSPEPKIIAALPPSKPKFKKRSRSPSPAYRGFNREPKNERIRKRSLSPPSFASAGSTNKTVEFLDEGNKGHQMLKKLGWQSGGGLGASNKGITEPISAGEVRDRTDLYKGIGMSSNSDPYENFRKNRSNNFITRMKIRDAEKN